MQRPFCLSAAFQDRPAVLHVLDEHLTHPVTALDELHAHELVRLSISHKLCNAKVAAPQVPDLCGDGNS